jgi:PIN domain nuclease of toxin-antitoxin system
MKYLVDTHVLLWSFIEPEKLSKNIKEILLDDENEIYYSPINLWEISIKYALKKLNLKNINPEEFYEELDNSYYLCKSMDNNKIISNYHLPLLHKDPFDRFLIWEAIQNDFILLTVDGTIKEYKKLGLKIINC